MEIATEIDDLKKRSKLIFHEMKYKNPFLKNLFQIVHRKKKIRRSL